MTELIYFFGRFHVLMLHIPIGLLLLAVVLEVLIRRPRFAHLASSVSFVWLAGALAAAATVALGFMHATEPGFESPAVNAHKFAGVFLLLVAFLVWGMRTLETPLYQSAWPAFCAVVVGLLALTGHYGGNLTHGETYLTAYAPAPLRLALGMPEPRSRPTDVASADLFLDVVQPAFEQRCVSCHNAGRRRGGLSLETYAAAMEGGESGAVITPGDAEGGDLVRRISLASSHDDFMPADGKTPLSAEQTAAIAFWVSQGAPASAAIGTLAPPEDVQAALAAVLGVGPGATSGETDAPPEVAPADPAAIAALEAAGFTVRPIAEASHLLDVDFTARRTLEDADLVALAALGPQIRALNLRDAGVTDAQLEMVAGFEHLARLRLELNPVTDAGIGRLTALGELETLNLYGAEVTDGVFAALAGLERLERVYLWGSGVSADGIDAFRAQRPDITVVGGFDADVFPEALDVIPVVN